jgi:hypothetical protein
VKELVGSTFWRDTPILFRMPLGYCLARSSSVRRLYCRMKDFRSADMCAVPKMAYPPIFSRLAQMI